MQMQVSVVLSEDYTKLAQWLIIPHKGGSLNQELEKEVNIYMHVAVAKIVRKSLS
jgi:hypothetical protein